MIEIKITIPDNEFHQRALDEQMAVLGFVRKAQTKPQETESAPVSPVPWGPKEYVGLSGTSGTNIAKEPLHNNDVESPLKKLADEMRAGTAVFVSAPMSQASVDVQFTNSPGAVAMDGDRERGKAGPGHRRRTNEQIKSDEAYFASLGGQDAAPLAPGSEAPLISTGEERLDPRDAADEAAETAARKSDKPTREDLRAAVGRYTEKFGPKASIDNIRQIIGKPMIEVTEDEMPGAIARVETAIAADSAAPSELAPADPVEAPQATKADVVEAFLAYGKKYDGTDVQANMSSVREDMPKILEATFGAGVVKISAIPQTPEGFGKALAAANAALRDNPFKREVKG